MHLNDLGFEGQDPEGGSACGPGPRATAGVPQILFLVPAMSLGPEVPKTFGPRRSFLNIKCARVHVLSPKEMHMREGLRFGKPSQAGPHAHELRAREEKTRAHSSCA